MNFLYLTVQNLWQRLKFFGNRQTDTHRQKGTQTDRTKQDFHELHLSEIEGWGGGYEGIPPEKICGIDAKLCYSGLTGRKTRPKGHCLHLNF